MNAQTHKDYLYVVWRDMISRSRYIVGELTKNGRYEFRYYTDHLEKAYKKGFTTFVAFPKEDEIYINDTLFAVFSSRLPDRKRRNIDEILKQYNLEYYDEFELLKKTGGRTPIDNLEFVEPIFLDNLEECNKIERNFFVAGTEYHDFCTGNAEDGCTLNIQLKVDDKVALVKEPDNEYDEYAVMVLTNDSLNKIGYIPSYFSKAIFSALNQGYIVNALVSSINRYNCQECVELKIEISK